MIRKEHRHDYEQQQREVGLMEKENKLKTSSCKDWPIRRGKAVWGEQGHNVLTAERWKRWAVTSLGLAFLSWQQRSEVSIYTPAFWLKILCKKKKEKELNKFVFEINTIVCVSFPPPTLWSTTTVEQGGALTAGTYRRNKTNSRWVDAGESGASLHVPHRTFGSPWCMSLRHLPHLVKKTGQKKVQTEI